MMNENEKKYIYIIIGLSVLFTMFLWGSFRGITTRDYELKRTRTELQSVTERLRSANERVEQLESGLTEVGDGLDILNRSFRENNTGLHSVVERLQVIADQVKHLEDRVHNLRNNNSSGSTSSNMEL